jgi:eukaryotic-like serine/threonine-protein kinase
MIPAGKILGDRYQIIKDLGEGGFGDTYLAKDSKLPGNPFCVVKHLQPKDPRPEVLKLARRLFETEAKVLYELGNESRQIPTLFAHFEEKGEFYLVQEFVDGHDLTHELIPGKKLSDGEVIALLKSILEILRVAHEHQPDAVIHRDIKPANIMRRKDGKIFLIDFGAVRQINQLIVNINGSVTTTIPIGTPGYAPAEQADGSPKLASDVYAVGMMGIEALTGVRPDRLQKDPRTAEIVWRHLIPRVDPKLASVLEMMVQYYFRNRYQNAGDALAAIYAFSPASPGVNIPPTPPPQPPNPPGGTIPVVGQPGRQQTWNPQGDMTRRRLLQLAGLGGAGAALAFLIPNLVGKQSSPSPSPSLATIPDKSPSPQASASPSPKAVAQASPSPATVIKVSPSPQTSLSSTSNGLTKWNFITAGVDSQGNIISRPQKEVEYFTEDIGSGINLIMIKIPGGSFKMGSTESSNEQPIHDVTIKPFYMGFCTVTQEQYQAVMGTNPAYFKGAKLPVEQVSWNDTESFCQKLSQKSGKKYRLPSEAEWEYACRAGTQTPFYFGETITSALVNYDGNYPYGKADKGVSRQKTVEADGAKEGFLPNGFGLSQMHGNVREWCSDIYHESYNGAPKDGSSWEIATKENYRVQRGGSWFDLAVFCRSANRIRILAGNSYSYIGFRVALAFA